MQLLPKLRLVANHVVVVQRTPNYVIPARSASVDDDEAADLRAHVEDNWRLAHGNEFGMAMRPMGKTLDAMGGDDQGIRQLLDKRWEAGGFHVPFESF